MTHSWRVTDPVALRPTWKGNLFWLPAGEATAFHCPTHGDFKVADTVLAKTKNYTRDQWEAALDKAEERTEPHG